MTGTKRRRRQHPIGMVGRAVRTALLAMLAVPSLAASPPAAAQDAYEAFVIRELRSVIAAAYSSGYHLTHSPFIDKLPRDTVHGLRVWLEADLHYVILGVCDQDCLDIDLVLYDENGHVIDKDLMRDDRPAVQARPAWSGPFVIEVAIPVCLASRCTYGVAILSD